MKRNYSFVMFLTSLLFLVSCGHSEVIIYDNMTYPPVKDCFVFNDLKSIPYQYDIIGTIKAWRSHNPIKADDVSELQLLGRINGADGIIEISKIDRLCSAKAIRFKRDTDGDLIRKK